MNQSFFEPSKVGCVWIVKSDLYPNYGNKVLPQTKTEGETAESPVIAQREGKAIMWNLAFVQEWCSSDEESMSHSDCDMSLSGDGDPIGELSCVFDSKPTVAKVVYTTTNSSTHTEVP